METNKINLNQIYSDLHLIVGAYILNRLCGFSELSHFFNLFKKENKTSPIDLGEILISY